MTHRSIRGPLFAATLAVSAAAAGIAPARAQALPPTHPNAIQQPPIIDPRLTPGPVDPRVPNPGATNFNGTPFNPLFGPAGFDNAFFDPTFGGFGNGFFNGANGFNGFNGVNGFNAFGNGFNNGFLNTGTNLPFLAGDPFFGYNPGYGSVVSVPPYNGSLGPAAPGIPAGAAAASRLPLLGVNTPAHTTGGGPVPPVYTAEGKALRGTRPDVTSILGGITTTAGANTGTGTAFLTRANGAGTPMASRTGTTGRTAGASTTIAVTPASTTLTSAAQRMASLMRTQAMVPGHVARTGATGVVVRVAKGRTQRLRRYALHDVFFSRNGMMLDASMSPGSLKRGDSVMVPERAGRAA